MSTLFKTKDSQHTYTPFIIWAVCIFSLWLGSYFALREIYDWDKRGTFGDTFGAINSLFSGLAFAGIIYTIILQKRELTRQQKELIESRRIQNLERKLTAHHRLLHDLEIEETRYDTTQFLGFKKATSNLIKETFSYSRQLQSRYFDSMRFISYLPKNPVWSLQLGRKVISEYLESFLFLIDSLYESDNEETNDQLSKLIYHSLGMNEKYLIGYLLELDINKRITERCGNYEKLFKLHYLSTQFPLKKDAELPPKFHLRIEDSRTLVKYPKERRISPNEGEAKFRADDVYPEFNIIPFMDEFNIVKVCLRKKTGALFPFDGENLAEENVPLKPEGNYFSIEKGLRSLNLLPDNILNGRLVYAYFEREKGTSTISLYLQVQFPNKSVFSYDLPLIVNCEAHSEGKTFIFIAFEPQ